MKKKLIPPKFKNEDEERDFWSNIDLSEYYEPEDFVSAHFPNLKPTSKNSSIHYKKPASKNDYVFEKSKDK